VDAVLSESSLEALLSSDPENARRRALEAATISSDASRVSYLTIAAEASVRVGAVADAASLFAQAIEVARASNDARLGALLVRRAAMVAASGDSDGALTELDDAEAVLGDERWRAWFQRGLVLHWMGRSAEALRWLERAEPDIRAAGDQLTVAKLTMNRALARAHVGDDDGAAADATEAERVCRAIGEQTLAAHARHNRGWIAARAGDLAGGWRLMHEASEDRAWVAPPIVMADRAELAEAAGLLVEASDWADAAIAAQREVGDDHGAATTEVLRARIALGLGHLERAEGLATAAIDALTAQGRPVLAAAGAVVRIEVARDRLQRGDTLAAEPALPLEQLHADLERTRTHPWAAIRVDALLAAGEAHAAAGATAAARRLFGAATRGDPSRTVGVRTLVARALALGPGRSATAALEGAWNVLDARRHAPIPEELRGDWGADARLLTRAALVPALRAGDADTAICWLERLRSPLVGTGTADEQLTAIARQLRDAIRRQREVVHDVDADGVVDLERAAFELEQHLIDRARSVAANIDGGRAPMTAAELATGIGASTLVWLVALPAGTWRVRLSIAGADVSSIDDGSVARDLAGLRSSLALGRADWRALAANADRALRTDEWGERPVVIGVGAPAEDIPWGALPGVTDRPLRMCWSGGHHARTGHPRDTAVVTLVAGDADGAAEEVALLRSVWPQAQVLVREAATAASVEHAVAASSLVHVGAHGHLRRDNPMLSSLDCADGPLYGYELARLPRAAGTIVLWSCGLGGARMPGDLGASGWSTLLEARGCGALIASASPFPSGPAPDLALALHRGLAAGEDSGAVLAALRTHASGDEARVRAATMLAVHGAG
jgi:tetratricopeptide (TPR) repeat protein